MITQEQYDAHCDDLRHGRKVVRIGGRRCATIEQLNHALDAIANEADHPEGTRQPETLLPQADEKPPVLSAHQQAQVNLMDLARSAVLEQEKAGLIADREMLTLRLKAVEDEKQCLEAENAVLSSEVDTLREVDAELRREIEALKAQIPAASADATPAEPIAPDPPVAAAPAQLAPVEPTATDPAVAMADAAPTAPVKATKAEKPPKKDAAAPTAETAPPA